MQEYKETMNKRDIFIYKMMFTRKIEKGNR